MFDKQNKMKRIIWIKDVWIEQERKISMGKKGKRSKKIVSCIIVLSVLFLSVGGYFAYPTLADIVLPKRHVINAFINFGGRLQDMVDSLSEKLEFMEMEGELEIHLDAFPKLREEITIQDDSDKIHIRFWFESNKIHIRASQLFENDILMEINLSDITQLKQSNISGQLPVEYKQYQEACKKLDRVLHEISKMDFKKHSDIISAASKDVVKGYTSMLQNGEYERLDNSDSDVVSYKIVFPQQLVEQGNNAVIDELYSDSKVLPYISILKMAAGISKDTLKEYCAQFVQYIGDIDFVVDIDEKTDTIQSFYAYLIYNGKEACNLTLYFHEQ